MRLALLLAFALCAATGLQVGSRATRNLIYRRGAPRARILAAKLYEPAKEGNSEPDRGKVAPGSGPLLDPDTELARLANEVRGSGDLGAMRARVAQLQAEIDATKSETEKTDAELEEELGLLGGVNIFQFVFNAIMALPEYEVLKPDKLLTKFLASVAMFVGTLVLVKVLDAAILEMLRPIVKWQVDNQGIDL
jgi:hypothetical protein